MEKIYKANSEKPRTWNVKTLNAVGRDLFDLQCVGRGEQRMQGDPVCIRSPFSPSRLSTTFSGMRTSASPILFPSPPLRRLLPPILGDFPSRGHRSVWILSHFSPILKRSTFLSCLKLFWLPLLHLVKSLHSNLSHLLYNSQSFTFYQVPISNQEKPLSALQYKVGF